MSYAVKECFVTLQGEGLRTGRVSVLCRMTGCNLWTGREPDRSKAICQFCDTDFVGTDGPGGGRFDSAEQLAEHIAAQWRDAVKSPQGAKPYVFFTGGEPTLQLDEPLIEACHALGFEVGIETNGTRACPQGIDWVCVSPKAGAPLVTRCGQELKLVYPQKDLPPELFEELAFDYFLLQPLDGPDRTANTQACIAYCTAHPRWRLSLQTHKLIGIR